MKALLSSLSPFAWHKGKSQYVLVHAGATEKKGKKKDKLNENEKPEVSNPKRLTRRPVYVNKEPFVSNEKTFLIRVYGECGQEQGMDEGSFHIAKKMSSDEKSQLKDGDWVVVKAKGEKKKMWRLRKVKSIIKKDHNTRSFELYDDSFGNKYTDRTEDEMIAKVL